MEIFFKRDEVADLVDFIQFTSNTQHALIAQKDLKQVQHKASSKIICFNHPKTLKYDYTSNLVYSSRLRALGKYFDWVVRERKAQRIQTNQVVEERLLAAQKTILPAFPK